MTGHRLPDFATWRGLWTIARNGKLGLHPSYGHRTTAETVASYWRELQPFHTFQAVPDVDFPEPCLDPAPVAIVPAMHRGEDGRVRGTLNYAGIVGGRFIPSKPHTGG